MQLIENPDELAKYPEIMAIMNNSNETESNNDWENIPEPPINPESNQEKTPVEMSSNIEEVTNMIASTDMIDDQNVEDDSVLEDVDPREHLNIVFIGHVDAGKSTLSGSILYIMGMVDKRTIEKYEREAKERNRESWFLAFIMDTSEEERAKGKTVEVGRAHFETTLNRYTILDAPGHKNYVPNMIGYLIYSFNVINFLI